MDINSESLRNLIYPIDWDALLDHVGRPAFLKPYSGGGWKQVYKVHNREELIAAYDGTGPTCMTLQENIDFSQYVRCFTFGKMDILPVVYDPGSAAIWSSTIIFQRNWARVWFATRKPSIRRWATK